MAEVTHPLFFQTQQRWALWVSCLLLLGPALFVAWLNSSEQIIPKADQRFDVSEIWLGAMRELCPGSTAAPLAAEIERCIGSLSIASAEPQLQRIVLPSVAQSPLLGFPDLPRLMLQQGLAPALKLNAGDGPRLLGLRIPARLFTKNHIGLPLQALVVAQLGDARVCFHGHCPYFADTHIAMGTRFPLYSDGSEDKRETVDVWIVSSAGPLSEAINLKQGLFVTLTDNLRTMDNIGTPMAMGGNIIASSVLLGIAMIALLCAWLWAEYLDFAAFAVLINLQFFLLVWTTAGQALGLSRCYPLLATAGRAFLLVQVAVAFIAVACATLRPRARHFWPAWALAGVGFGAVVLSLYLKQLGANLLHSVEQLTASLQLVIPPFIAVTGALILKRLPAASPELQKAHAVAVTRRLREQMIMAVCLALAALPDYLAVVQTLPDHMPSPWRLAGALAILPAFGALLYSAGGKFRSRSEIYRNDLIAMAKQAAVGEMIQMLAHDVRKPFSLLRIGLQALLTAKSLEDMRMAIERLVPQVKKAMASVQAMLEDVRAVNLETQLSLDVVHVESLITQCLHDVMVGRHDLDVKLSYEWRHKRLLVIDSLKILRVLNNIVDNAIQATKGSCHLWFHSEERLEGDGRAWLDLTIGNSGSVIPQDQLETIFEAFFTRGKASGTGLGLAVARKFVALHGGWVRCRSDASRGTEFILTLPLAATETLPTATGLPQPYLPKHSSSLSDAMTGVKETVLSAFNSPLNEREEDLLGRLLRAVAGLARPLSVLLVEHRPLYAAALTSLLEPLTRHALDDTPAVSLLQAAHPEEAYAHAWMHDVDLALVDADLALLNKLELITTLSGEDLVTTLCVQAEPGLSAEDRRNLSQVVSHIVPQPTPRETLLEVLATAANTAMVRLLLQQQQQQQKQQQKQEQEQEPATLAAQASAPPADSPELVVVADDDIFIREIWQQALAPTSSRCFASPEALLAWLESGGAQHPIACFVLDLHFDGTTALDGLQLAQAVRRLSGAPILLSTDALVTLAADSPVAALIPKEPTDLGSLLGYLSSAKKTDVAG